MLTIIAAVLSIALFVLIARTIKDDAKALGADFKAFFHQLFSKDTVVEAKDDFKHIVKTIGKAFVQIGRALKLTSFWLFLPLIVVGLVIAALAALIYKAYTV